MKSPRKSREKSPLFDGRDLVGVKRINAFCPVFCVKKTLQTQETARLQRYPSNTSARQKVSGRNRKPRTMGSDELRRPIEYV